MVRIGMGCKASFVANSGLLATKATQRTARVRARTYRRELCRTSLGPPIETKIMRLDGTMFGLARDEQAKSLAEGGFDLPPANRTGHSSKNAINQE